MFIFKICIYFYNKYLKFTNGDRSTFTLQQDSILQQIHKRLIDTKHLSIIQKDKKVTILSIEVTSENEFFSKYSIID